MTAAGAMMCCLSSVVTAHTYVQIRRETHWKCKGISIDQSIDQSVHQLATVQSNNQKMRVVHNPVYPLVFSSFEQSNNFKVLTYTVEQVLWFC